MTSKDQAPPSGQRPLSPSTVGLAAPHGGITTRLPQQPAGSTDAHLPARNRQSKDGLAPCLRSFKNLEAIRSAAGRAEEAEASDSRFYSYGSVEASGTADEHHSRWLR